MFEYVLVHHVEHDRKERVEQYEDVTDRSGSDRSLKTRARKRFAKLCVRERFSAFAHNRPQTLCAKEAHAKEGFQHASQLLNGGFEKLGGWVGF